MTDLRPLLLAMRVLALVALALGIALWTGHPVPWRGLHMGTGLLLAGALIALGIVVTRAARAPGALLAAVGWAVVLLAYGIAHARLLAGSAHWVAQLLHVLIGLATLGIAERLAGTARRSGAPVA